MSGPLPEFVDPFRLARDQTRIEGAVPIAAMKRVAELLRDDSGVAEVDLRFQASASGVPRLDGGIRMVARVECQRCLEPLELELLPEFKISFTDGGEASGRAELAAGYEPLDLDGPIGLTTIVEDEILLALPDSPMHSSEQCAPAGAVDAPGAGSSPFSGLRARLEQFRT